jgi:VIT1/CCC1 family predicted Fe2+/Mn2+ transporter
LPALFIWAAFRCMDEWLSLVNNKSRSVLMCFIAVLPSMVPLALLPNHFDLAIRLSNMISFIVLFFAGYHWGKYSGINPFKTGLLLLGIGIVLALVAIPLGG